MARITLNYQLLFLMKKTILIIILFQFLIIIFLSINIYLEVRKKSLNKISVNPINKESIVFNPNKEIHYFYELSQNSIQYAKEYRKVDWLDYQAKYTINKDGLNERYDYSINKPKKTFRIITLGDSFTFGSYVNTENNWTEKLEDTLNFDNNCSNIDKFEVINLGVYGYDLQYSYQRFKVRGIKYKPDLIIWFIKDDDLNQLNEIMLPKVIKFQKQMENNGELENKLKEGDIYPYWTKAIKDTYNSITENEIVNIQLTFLGRFQSIYRGKLLITTFPFTKPAYIDMLRALDKDNKRIFLFNNLNNIYSNKLNYYPDSHPTIKGHELIAKSIANFLKRNNEIIPCN